MGVKLKKIKTDDLFDIFSLIAYNQQIEMVEIISRQSESPIIISHGPTLTGGVDFQREQDPNLANTEITTYQHQDITLQKEFDLKKGKTIWRSMFNADFSAWEKDGLTVPMPANLIISQDDASIRKNTELDFEDPAMQDLLNKTIASLNQLKIKLPKPEIRYKSIENTLRNLFEDEEIESNRNTVNHLKKGNIIMIVEGSDEGRIECAVGKIENYGEEKEVKRGIEILSDIFRRSKTTKPKADNCQNKMVTLKKSALQITFGFFLSNNQKPELHINKILKAIRKPKFTVDTITEREEKRFFSLQNTDFQKLKDTSREFVTRNSSF